MIDEKELQKLRKLKWETVDRESLDMVFDTLEALWKVARAAEEFVDSLDCLNKEATDGLKDLEKALSALKEAYE
jgi:hypothetical protein